MRWFTHSDAAGSVLFISDIAPHDGGIGGKALLQPLLPNVVAVLCDQTVEQGDQSGIALRCDGEKTLPEGVELDDAHDRTPDVSDA
jgi:hypothetical protein